ncbi:hypothetical protein TNIN_226771 [Trichonephila inaurata madagascariensis]|uniref:Uncharacterized protein n=1 Tax=Trichonephila inaurata madagascariensis TaxID=2747483 RepID=A0A8X7C8I5_9ARAC|nr:hypothetical protein TNIN_226771 [Trichonephila inaurata madagascariensis]
MVPIFSPCIKLRVSRLVNRLPQQIGFGDSWHLDTFCKDISIYWVLDPSRIHLFRGHSALSRDDAFKPAIRPRLYTFDGAPSHARSHIEPRGGIQTRVYP